MYIDELVAYCQQKKGVTQDMPFDQDILCFKVASKIFLLLSLDDWEKSDKKVNLKCDPTWALELRENYQSIVPGYHMNKKHWNTVCLDADVDRSFFFELVDHSYDMVIKGLTKAQQKELL